MVLKDTENVICPWCNRITVLKEYDDYTFSQCVNRAERRKYVKLSDEKAWSRINNHYYRCPKCTSWCKGNQLRLDTDDAELKKLGGAPLDITYTDRDGTSKAYTELIELAKRRPIE